VHPYFGNALNLRLYFTQAFLLVQSLKLAPRASHYESILKKKTMFLIYHFVALTWPQCGKKKKKKKKNL
jgi:hypothetical protein